MSTEKSCPICEKPAVEEAYRPFCSKRCADVDLNRWFTGVYKVPATEDSESSPEATEESQVAGQSLDPQL